MKNWILSSAGHMARPFWVVLGLCSLLLGAIGVVLPLLPTTPLVLLAAFAFTKGSPRLAAMIENNRVFGPILMEWRAHGVIAPKYKMLALSMMVAAFLGSILYGVPLYALILQGIAMTGAAVFVLSRPSYTA